ncbi:hypothetical protein Tco_0140627 [Tanacetum coccineum]
MNNHQPPPAPTSEVPYEPHTDSSPAHTSEVPIEHQPVPSPRPSPTASIPDSIPEPTGENLGDHSSNDTSLSGNEDDMTPKNVLDHMYLFICQLCSRSKPKKSNFFEGQGSQSSRSKLNLSIKIFKDNSKTCPYSKDSQRELLKEHSKVAEDAKTGTEEKVESTAGQIKDDPTTKVRSRMIEEDESESEDEGYFPQAVNENQTLESEEEFGQGKFQEEWGREEREINC